MNSEEIGIQSILCVMFGEKIETPDSKEFQIHSFSSTDWTFSSNSKSDLKEEKGDGSNDSNLVRSSPSTLQNTLSVKAEGPDRYRYVPDLDFSRISKATSSKQLGYKKKSPRCHIGDKAQRMFSCMVCSKKFTRSYDLKTHLRSHTGDRPFSCEICSKSYTTSSHLKKRLRVHSGERPFSCEVCSKSFTQSSNLKDHLRVHTEHRPFRCDICSKRFNHSRIVRASRRVNA